MQSFSKKIALLTCFIPSVVFGDVTIKLNQGTDILAVNGKAVERSSLFDSTGSLRLENGKNQIVVEYTAEIEESSDDSILETSESYVLLFEAKDTEIKLQTPKITNHYDLKKFNQSPQWMLVDSQGRTLPYQSGILKKEGFQLARDYTAELMKFNQSGVAAAMPALRVERHQFNEQPVVKKSAEPASNADQKMIGEMLQYWYQQADEPTRNKFKSWIKTSL